MEHTYLVLFILALVLDAVAWLSLVNLRNNIQAAFKYHTGANMTQLIHERDAIIKALMSGRVDHLPPDIQQALKDGTTSVPILLSMLTKAD